MNHWFFMNFPSTKQPVENETTLLVEPNERGGWSLRFSDEPIERRIGNYPSAQDAVNVAKANCTNVRIIEPKKLPQGTPVSTLRSVEEQLRNLLIA